MHVYILECLLLSNTVGNAVFVTRKGGERQTHSCVRRESVNKEQYGSNYFSNFPSDF